MSGTKRLNARREKVQKNSIPTLSDAHKPLLKLDEFLPYRLNVLASTISLGLARIYGVRHGMTIPQWRVLVHLGQFGSMTGSTIGMHTHMHKAKVSRAARQLEARGLLIYQGNKDDMRESFLSLTLVGQELYYELSPRAIAFSKMLIEALPPADRVVFDRAITTLTEFTRQLR